MKALSLTQPWASLVAVGAKRLETRSWPTSYRGPIAIHASKGWSADDRAFAMDLVRRGVIPEPPPGIQPVEPYLHIPLGAVVATAIIEEVFPAERCDVASPAWWYLRPPVTSYLYMPPTELDYGDFAPGRYAWLLRDVKALSKPVPARGSLGLWDWTPPEGLPL